MSDQHHAKARDAEQLTAAAAQFAKAGGDVLRSYFRGKLRIEHKGVANLVSEADLEAEKRIVALIREQFPNDAILAEEGFAETRAAESLWIIDPLDGTNNFAHGLAHFATSVAYYHAGVAQCGAIYDPIRDELFTATRGGGAFRNGERLRVSEADALDQCLVATGFYYDRGDGMRRTLRTIEALFDQNIHGIRRCGASTLDLCGVAEGTYGAYFELHLSPWDFAAGRLIVEEAGGIVTDCGGGALPLAATPVLASNGRLHEAMLKIIQDHA